MKTKRIVPKTIKDESTRKFLQDMVDDLFAIFSNNNFRVEGRTVQASDGELLSFPGAWGVVAVNASYTITADASGVRASFQTGSKAKTNVKILVITEVK